jgi:hypothetical protein
MKEKVYLIGGEFDLTARMIDKPERIIQMLASAKHVPVHYSNSEPVNITVQKLFYIHQCITKNGVHIYELDEQ